MATRALVDASIDAFWNAAGTGAQELRKPSRPVVTPRRFGPDGAGAPSLPTVTRKSGGSSSSASAALRAEANAEYRGISVELRGREGYNAAAINGIWHFWRVRAGRLAFRRTVQVPCEEAEHKGALGQDMLGEQEERNRLDSGAEAGRTLPPAPEGGAVQLYLFYEAEVDAWLISDAPDTSGNIAADCGPVGRGMDFGQHWRVWDAKTWCEDRNITAEVTFGGPVPGTLEGLRIVPAGTAQGARLRAQSQDQMPLLPEPRRPSLPRPPDTARPVRGAPRW